ncbi:hypothetical protein L6164_020468 [Bauhinia variegata]|uniref:Uncharacterized protein n=1 Tax=Bauhinia variegata TaxID=167791 RepID=A0ACB9MVH4_BAUVA|nr:hypothetical protein L6164_020468 [Bauhinia variegata]
MITTDANPTLKMENKQSVTAIQDNPTMKPVDQKARSKGRNDIMTRRLKNRERQRRYRARKRLEAEINKSSVIKVEPPVQAEPESNGNHNNIMTRRICCKRDWKKDARRAHALKIQQVTPSGSIDPFQTISDEPAAGCLGNKAEPALNGEIQSCFSSGLANIESPRVVLSRRDWKAEARKNKN